MGKKSMAKKTKNGITKKDFHLLIKKASQPVRQSEKGK